MSRRARVFGIAAMAVLAGGLVAAGHASGVYQADRAEALLAELGIWAPILYVAAFALLEPFGAPGILFIVPASVVWPFWLAFLLSWIGAIGAGLVGFGFARAIGRDWVEAHLPGRLRAYDRKLAESGFATVILVRLLFFLAPPAHWVLGLSRVGVVPFVAGSAVGFLPGIALLTFVSMSLLDWLLAQPTQVWVGVGLLAAAGVLVHGALGRRRERSERAAPAAAETE